MAMLQAFDYSLFRLVRIPRQFRNTLDFCSISVQRHVQQSIQRKNVRDEPLLSLPHMNGGITLDFTLMYVSYKGQNHRLKFYDGKGT